MPLLNSCSRFAAASLAAAGIAIALTLSAAPAAQAQPQPGWNGGAGPGMQPAVVPPPARPGRGGPVVRCESNNGRYKECRVPFRGPAVLVRQLSSTRCIPGRTYGNKGGRIWVSGGCRGEFAPR